MDNNTLNELISRLGQLEKRVGSLETKEVITGVNTTKLVDDLQLGGDLVMLRNNTQHTGAVYVPLPDGIPSTVFNVFRSTAGWQEWDVLADFSGTVPAGAKAIYLQVTLYDSSSSTSNSVIVFNVYGAEATTGIYVAVSGLGNNRYHDHQIIAPLNSEGKIYFRTVASGTNTLYILANLWGYWL